MSVNIHSHTNIGMAQAGLHSLGVYSGLQQSGRTAVAQVMEADIFEVVSLKEPSPLSRHGLRAERRTIFLTNYDMEQEGITY